MTHPEITRYFMSIGEAARLVIQAGAMSKNGEVFLLDMGQPVKIKDLALQMIELSGLVPEKDIPLQYTGLRPGEKLYEELFIGNKVSRTDHDQIMRTDENFVSWSDLEKDLADLNKAIESYDFDLLISIMGKRIDGFDHDKKIIDDLFLH